MAISFCSDWIEARRDSRVRRCQDEHRQASTTQATLSPGSPSFAAICHQGGHLAWLLVLFTHSKPGPFFALGQYPHLQRPRSQDC